MKAQPVRDQPHLLKDCSTGAILNRDDDAYNHALIRKKNATQLQQLRVDVATLLKRVDHLESLLISDK